MNTRSAQRPLSHSRLVLRRTVQTALAGVLLCSALVTTARAATTVEMPALGIDIKETSVSGLSSGAFMTSQVYIVFSDIMKGAGIVAGGPYYCAGSWSFNTYLQNATGACMNPLTPSVGPNVPALLAKTQQLSKAGSIDPTTNLSDDHIYMFSGTQDTTVTTMVMDANYQYLTQLGVPAANIEYIKNVAAGHAFITDSKSDTSCGLTQPPYINYCPPTEQADAIIQQIYADEGPVNPPAASASGELLQVDQKAFLPTAMTSMSDNAYLYVPKSCEQGGCRLHIALHGCEQGYKVIGDQYYSTTGYNEMADTNKLVILYPQAEPSQGAGKPYNPKGCWDFWGYSATNPANPDFYTRDAPQLKAIKAMIDRLAQPVQ
ncbi:poly(3-hydroxybutyrate) depolymerase [Pokkaliibacter plantistimulans]|nr:poly(3-hydroxybutyrate) depolymerase [Pokkaliibacter plantistimulans]